MKRQKYPDRQMPDQQLIILLEHAAIYRNDLF